MCLTLGAERLIALSSEPGDLDALAGDGMTVAVTTPAGRRVAGSPLQSTRSDGDP